MKFTLNNNIYTSTWKLGSKKIPVTVHDPDTETADSIKPILPTIEPLLAKWEIIKGKALKILQEEGENCSEFEPETALISVLSDDNIVVFEITVPLVEYLPDQELIARIAGNFDLNQISVEIDSKHF